MVNIFTKRFQVLKESFTFLFAKSVAKIFLVLYKNVRDKICHTLIKNFLSAFEFSPEI